MAGAKANYNTRYRYIQVDRVNDIQRTSIGPGSEQEPRQSSEQRTQKRFVWAAATAPGYGDVPRPSGGCKNGGLSWFRVATERGLCGAPHRSTSVLVGCLLEL